MVDLTNLVAAGAAAQGVVSLGVVTLALLITGSAVVGDVWSKRSVTVIDATIIGLFFVLVGAATPVGGAVRYVLDAVSTKLGG